MCIYVGEIRSINMLLYNHQNGAARKMVHPSFPMQQWPKHPAPRSHTEAGGLGDKLMSEHVLRRGGMRESEIPFEMTSRVLLL